MKCIKTNLVFLICCFALSHPCLSAPEILKQAEQVIGAKGNDYLTARNELVKTGKDNAAALKSVMATSGDWRIKTVAAIALERVENEDAINELLQWKPDKISSRVPEERIRGYGEMLKSKAQAVPLVLVERVWKGNELALLPNKDEDIACAAYALGELGTPDARQPLELLLDHDDYQVRMTAAVAIGKLKSSESVRPLLDFVVKGFQTQTDISHAAASEALAQCATKESVPMLKETLSKVESGDIKDKANRLRSLLKLLIMALEK